MADLRGPWTPYELPKLFLPVSPDEHGGCSANGFDGFRTLTECQAECDRRNAASLAAADLEIARLEVELDAIRAIRSGSRRALVASGAAT